MARHQDHMIEDCSSNRRVLLAVAEATQPIFSDAAIRLVHRLAA